MTDNANTSTGNTPNASLNNPPESTTMNTSTSSIPSGTLLASPQQHDLATTTHSDSSGPMTATRERNEANPHHGRKATAWSVARGEWIKFWSVRSTATTLIAAGFATIAFGMIFSAVAGDEPAPGPAAGLTSPIDLALAGSNITQLIVGVLGVLFVASEYATGLISTWFAAAGERRRVVIGKTGVLATSVLAMGAMSVTLAVILGQAVYAGDLATVPLADAVDVIVGTVVYLVGISLIGLALGFILRSTAAGIGVLVGGVFIGPNLLGLLPDSITDVFLKYLPSEAGAAMMSSVSNPELLSTGAAYAVFAAWVIGLLVAAGVLVSRRDA